MSNDDPNVRLTNILRRLRLLDQRLYALPTAIELASRKTDRIMLGNNVMSARLEIGTMIEELEEILTPN